jgi:putative DNA primase/helicase
MEFPMNYRDFFKTNIQNLKISSSGQGTGLCPLHEDRHPSFSCNVEDGLWKCHGCEKSGNAFQLAKLLGVDSPKDKIREFPLQEIACYTYEDQNRKPLFQVRRYYPKTFRQFRYEQGEWIPGLNGTNPVLYKLPQILNPQIVYIAEGEKDAETLWNFGLPATCNPMGAGKWKEEYSEWLKDKSIVIIPDQDDAGKNHGNDVARKLWGIAKTVKIISLPLGKDISEWKELGGTPEELQKIIQETPFLSDLDLHRFSISHPPYKTYKTNRMEEWPEILPLTLQKAPDPILLESLPLSLARVIHHISQVVQVPPELPLSVALSVLSTAIGRRASIQLPTHREVSSLYTCCILEPGSRKSETFKLLLLPILEAEERLVKDWKHQWKKWRAEADLAEEMIRDCRHRSKKIQDSQGKETLITQMTQAHSLLEEEPIKPQLWTEDTTSESLRKLVVENGSIGVFSAEGGSVLEGFGRYSGTKGADLGIWLAGHAGDPGKVTRVKGDSSTSKEQLINVCLTAQRHVLQSVGRDPMLKGRGLIDRFLWFIPADPRGTRSYDNPFVLSSEILNEWSNTVDSLLLLSIDEKSPSVELTRSAQTLWKEFAKEVESRQAAGGDLRSISGWASKLAGQVGRIALVFHLSERKTLAEPIPEKIMASAIQVGQSLIAHGKAAFSLIGEDEEITKARIIAEHIQKNGLKEIKPRYIQQMGWAGCSDSEEVYKTLKRLELHGILQERVVERKNTLGRSPGNLFWVNPSFKDFPLTEEYSPKRSFVGSVGFVGWVENNNLEEGSVVHDF